MMNRFRLTLATAAGLSLTAAALAVQPASWTHTSEADFAAGETQNVVVTNLGDVKLAAGTQTLAEAPEDASIFNDIQPLGGELYIAAGPEGRLLRREGDTFEEVIALDAEQLFTLDVYEGSLLLGISAENSRLAVLEGDELRTLVELPGIRYIWDLMVRDGAIFLATGTDGRILRIDPDQLEPQAEPASAGVPVPEPEPASTDLPQPDDASESDEATSPDDAAEPTQDTPGALDLPGVTEVLSTAQANVLRLGHDARGRIYAGTDTDGLIYRLTPRDDGSYDTFVIYDAAEPEIGALLVMDDGTVYAGTADAAQARPGRLAEAQARPAGRPEIADAPPAGAAPDDVEMPDPGDMPQVPPEAGPIGDPDNDDAAPGEGDDDAPADPSPAPTPEPEPAAAPEPQTHPEAEPDDAHAAADGVVTPTPEQYDRLREVIRNRLSSGQRSGQLQTGSQTARRPSASPAGATRARPAAQPAQTKEGNAVYRIDSQGFVSEVFRESVMILQIVPSGSRLLIATGNEGQIFSVDPRAQETTTLVDLDAEQIPVMLPSPDGAESGVMLGTANPAALVLLGDQAAETGTYTSPILDAKQISLWGGVDLTARIPDGSSVLIQTRSGNVQDPEQAPWSPWTDGKRLEAAPELPPLQPRHIKVQAPPARFLQYRLTFTPAGSLSPVVEQVQTTYVMPNMRPRIASVQASYPDAAAGSGRQAGGSGAGGGDARSATMNIEWEASDPNEDRLRYRLEYQPAGSDIWLLIAEDLTEKRHEWDTRRVPDGRYIIRVTADDRLDNPGAMARTAVRRSEPVLVDNSQPQLRDLAIEQDGGRVVIRGTAFDALSNIRSIAYVINSDEEYQPVLPEDLIFDSTEETFDIKLDGLSPGSHAVTLRVTDARGNTTYRSVLLEIRK